MLKKIFQIISFYDKARWSSTSNYNSINFIKKTLVMIQNYLLIGFVISQIDKWHLNEFGKLGDLFFLN